MDSFQLKVIIRCRNRRQVGTTPEYESSGYQEVTLDGVCERITLTRLPNRNGSNIGASGCPERLEFASGIKFYTDDYLNGGGWAKDLVSCIAKQFQVTLVAIVNLNSNGRK